MKTDLDKSNLLYFFVDEIYSLLAQHWGIFLFS